MKIPWILYVGAGSHALPLVLAAIRRPSLGPARAWVLVWCAFWLVLNAVALALALSSRNNHFLRYVATPLASALILWAFSYWQVTPLAVLTVRLLIPVLAIAWLPIVLLVEDPRSFSLLAEPFAGLVVLSVAVYTLAARSLRETGRVTRQDWFWVASGVAIYIGTVIALPPTSYWLLARHPELVVRAYQVNAVVDIVAFLAIGWGVTRAPYKIL